MRYERLKDIITLAIRLQGSRLGVTLADIESEFSVSRRTAERLRDAVEWAFGPLEEADSNDGRKHWRLRSDALRRLVSVSADELGALSTAAAALERTGLREHAAKLEEVADKLRALHRAETLERLETDGGRSGSPAPCRRPRHAAGPEAAGRQDGARIAPTPGDPSVRTRRGRSRWCCASTRRTRPWRRTRTAPSILTRCAPKGGIHDYLSRTTGQRSRQIAEPYGLLYGNRPFLVARTAWGGEPRLWRLANVSGARLTLDNFDRDPAFDLRSYARRSFGAFQERPIKVVLRFDARAAPDASAFLFHPDQTVEENEDGASRHSAFRGRWPRRDVLAPLHLGRQRHRGEARPTAPPAG